MHGNRKPSARCWFRLKQKPSSLQAQRLMMQRHCRVPLANIAKPSARNHRSSTAWSYVQTFCARQIWYTTKNSFTLHRVWHHPKGALLQSENIEANNTVWKPWSRKQKASHQSVLRITSFGWGTWLRPQNFVDTLALSSNPVKKAAQFREHAFKSKTSKPCIITYNIIISLLLQP